MTWRAEDEGCGAELHRRSLPAYIGDVRGGWIDLPLIPGVEDVPDEVYVDIALPIRQLDASQHPNLLLLRDGLSDLGCELKLLIGVLRRPYLPHILDDHLAQHLVRQQVIGASEDFSLHLRLRHQRRALGDLQDPLVDGLHLIPLRRPDVIPAPRIVWNDVWLGSPELDDVVYPRLIDYMLPEIVDAYVHQLHRIEGAPPHLRRAGRMARLTVEVELDRCDGVAAA